MIIVFQYSFIHLSIYNKGLRDREGLEYVIFGFSVICTLGMVDCDTFSKKS